MRQGDGGNFRLLPDQHARQPVRPRLALEPVPEHDLRYGTQIQQASDVTVAHLRDPTHLLLASGGVRLGCQPKPSGIISRAIEIVDIRRRCGNDRCRQYPNTWDRSQTLACLVLLEGFFDLVGQPIDPLVRLGQLIEELAHRQLGSFRQPVQLFLQSIDILRALRRYDAELRHVGPDRISDLRALTNQKVPRAVNHQNR